MADIRNFVQRLRLLKNKIDRGEDFSQGIKYNENMLQDPEMSWDAIKKKSAAAAGLLLWLQEIIKYAKAKRAESQGESNNDQRNIV